MTRETCHQTGGIWSVILTTPLLLLLTGCPRPPAKPEVPRGPARGYRGVVLACTTRTTDPSGSDISYQFDWGDNHQSEWSTPPVPSGTVFADTHTYSEAGYFDVRVRARNAKNKVSAWSDPLTLLVDPGEGEPRWWFGYAPDPESPEDSAEFTGSTFALGLDGNLFISGGDMAALLSRNILGNRRWEFIDPNYDEFATPVIMPDSTIIVGTSGGTIFRIKPSGIKKEGWLAPPTFNADILVPVALGADNTIYLQTDNDSAYALSANDGSKRWSFHRGGGVVPPVVGTDGTVYICQEETLYALDPTNGNPKWRYGMNQNITAAMAIDPGRSAIYVGDEAGCLASVDLSDGTENWRAELGDQPSPPVIGPGGVIYTYANSRLTAINPADGGFLWFYAPPLLGSGSAAAVSSDDRIYFLVIPDKRDRLIAADSLYCVNYQGERRWACGLGSGGGTELISAPKIDAEGCVYIGDGNRAWCVVGKGGPAPSPWPMYQHDFQNTGRAGQ